MASSSRPELVMPAGNERPILWASLPFGTRGLPPIPDGRWATSGMQTHLTSAVSIPISFFSCSWRQAAGSGRQPVQPPAAGCTLPLVEEREQLPDHRLVRARAVLADL